VPIQPIQPIHPIQHLVSLVWGSAISSPSGCEAEPQPKSNLVHFSLEIWQLVATTILRENVIFHPYGRTLLPAQAIFRPRDVVS